MSVAVSGNRDPHRAAVVVEDLHEIEDDAVVAIERAHADATFVVEREQCGADAMRHDGLDRDRDLRRYAAAELVGRIRDRISTG
jgi:hypothetical protein